MEQKGKQLWKNTPQVSLLLYSVFHSSPFSSYADTLLWKLLFSIQKGYCHKECILYYLSYMSLILKIEKKTLAVSDQQVHSESDWNGQCHQHKRSVTICESLESFHHL